MITHAKVRYEDDRKQAVVSIDAIENFNPQHTKDFKSKFFYSVKWTDPDGTSDYYRARILALGESEEDFEIDSENRPRLRFERMAYSPNDESEDDDVPPERPARKQHRGPKHELLQILKKKTSALRQREVEASPQKLKRKKVEDFGDPRVLNLREKVQRLEDVIEKKERKIEEVLAKNKTLEQEAKDLRQLNMRLQEKMLMMLDNKGMQFSFPYFWGCDILLFNMYALCLARLLKIFFCIIAMCLSSVKFFLQHIPLVQVDIGRGLAINAQAWSHIQGHQKDSLFVKDLLLGIWPKDQLKNRSLQGKRCPRYPDRPAKAPLTPSKVEVMRGKWIVLQSLYSLKKICCCQLVRPCEFFCFRLLQTKTTVPGCPRTSFACCTEAAEPFRG
ncbi:BEN domain-containing protein 5-like [Dermacentor andersoni]|uniref:BEN domain-containing protein 5-like n=1 Tax=Dermacentor andersoni TaxID=34620 RepID=UPI002417D2A5|nr:BEN domain-containing protein 5-like [Dermacentor andersoni]